VVDKLDQFRAGLPLGRIHILVAFDDVDVDAQAGGIREPGIFLGNFPVPVRAEVPNGRRIFDQKSKFPAGRHREKPGGVRADRVPHPSIEPVVHMGEDQVEIGFSPSQCLQFGDPFGLDPPRQFRAKVQKASQPRLVFRVVPGGSRVEEIEWIETRARAKLPPDIIVHRREPRWIPMPLQGFEIQLREVDAIPIEALDKLPYAFGRCLGALAV